MSTNTGASKTKKGKKKGNNKDLSSVVEKTIKEMITDLSKIDGISSGKLEKYVKTLSKDALLKEIQDSNSKVLKLIPKDLLQRDVAGRRYLKVLSVLQSKLAPEDEKVLEERDRAKKAVVVIKNEVDPETDPHVTPVVPAVKTTTTTTTETIDPDLEKIMNGAGNDNLKKLADDVIKDLKLDDPNQNLGPAEIMGMISNIQEYVTKKVEKGELDMEKLESDARNFCVDMEKSKEFQETLKSNPQLASMMKMGMAGASNDAGGDPMAALSGLMGMFGGN